jgi:hypothetical protein
MIWLWISVFLLIALPVTSLLINVSTRNRPALRIFLREFQQFGVTFALVVLVWTSALVDTQIYVAVAVGVIAGIYGGVRGISLLTAKRQLYESEMASWPDELRIELEQPSAWQLKSTLKGIGGAAVLIGLIVWGIRAAF